MGKKINWDAVGVTTSVLCAIHCALLPLFLSSLPLFGMNIVDNEGFEFGMIALAFAVGIYSLYHGFKHHHHQWTPFILFAIGFLFLLAKQHWHQAQFYLLPPALLFIVYAHYRNFNLTNQYNKNHKNC